VTDDRAVRIVVSGRVQGVGFRWWLARKAEQLSICGWVRNLPDGSVEIVAAGAPKSLSELERHAAAGPRSARVEHVDKSDVPHHMIVHKSFLIR